MSFENAAITKGLMITLALTSIFAGLFDIKHYFHLQLTPHLSRHHQYWRLITHLLAFPNSSDLFLSELILYNVGVHVERQFGSIKYASFTFVSLLVATLLELSTLLLFHRAGLNQFAFGPTALVFSILYQYSRIVPPVYTYRVFNVPLNNKSMNYLLAFQLAISRPLSSIAVACIGVMTGQIYRSDIAGLNTYRLPSMLVNWAQSFVGPFIGSLRPPRRTNRAYPEDIAAIAARLANAIGQNQEVITTARTPRTAAPSPLTTGSNETPPAPSVMREWVDELTGRADRANAGLRVPTESEISNLTSMFPSMDRQVIVGALQRR
ncbi:hypothetical protein CPB83DRAFT_842583 [Crepidotus variabilis]|uniref:Derlin n=1 Tax=Crepidotus variabilis TaxID=179855 RepID=A0A9P6ETM0_9AGAR|nr:hypothetical protein CPB83DRAFT_842583 [Crepidotus variabilis]